MALVPPTQQNYIQSLFHDSQHTLYLGSVESTHQTPRQYWTAWNAFLQTYFPGTSPYLQNIPHNHATELLAAFAHHVRTHGGSTTRTPLQAQTFSVALSVICKTTRLDGQPPILAQQKGSPWPYRIAHLLKAYRRQDPTPRPALAIPVMVLKFLRTSTQTHFNTIAQTQADFCIIAFFFLLRVGEYTYHKPTQRQCTTQFRLQDICLWEGTKLLDPRLPMKVLTQCCTAHQRHSHMPGQSSNPSTNQHPFEPLAHSQHHYRSPFQPRTPTWFHHSCPPNHHHTKNTVKALNLQQHCLPPDLISSHSLRAGGATALHLSGCDAKSIQILGRWSSDTFLTYIHHQIDAFSLGSSKRMATRILFHNTHQPHIQPSIDTLQPS